MRLLVSRNHGVPYVVDHTIFLCRGASHLLRVKLQNTGAGNSVRWRNLESNIWSIKSSCIEKNRQIMCTRVKKMTASHSRTLLLLYEMDCLIQKQIVRGVWGRTQYLRVISSSPNLFTVGVHVLGERNKDLCAVPLNHIVQRRPSCIASKKCVKFDSGCYLARQLGCMSVAIGTTIEIVEK